MKAVTLLEILQCILMIQRGIIVPVRGAYAGQTRLTTRKPQSQNVTPQSTSSGYHHDTAIDAEESENDQDHNKITNLKYGPQVGARYNLTTKIPVIGVQTFQLRILREDVAELMINGVLRIKDTIHYKVDQQSGELSFDLSERTNMILKKFRTKLLKATYCPKRDRPSIIVRPPLPMNLSLHLKRQICNAHQQCT